MRPLSSRAPVLALVGALAAAAITAPFFFVDDLELRLAIAIAIALIAGTATWLLAARAARTRAERLERDRALRESLVEAKRMHGDLVEALPLTVWHYAPGARSETSFVSPQLERLVGFAPEQWSGQLADQVMHPDDRERVRGVIEKAVHDGSPFDVEYRLIARTGNVVTVREQGMTVRDADGNARLGQSFLLDIGDRVATAAERDRLRLSAQAADGERAERQRRLDLLRSVAHVATSAVDARTTAERAAALLVHDFADWCVVDLRRNGAPPTRAIVVRATAAASGSDATPDGEPGPAVQAVIDSGRPQLVPSPGNDPATSDVDGLLGPIGARSLISVPLRTATRSLGALTVSRSDPARLYGPEELAFVEDIAFRIAFSIEHAELSEEVERGADAARVLAHVGDGVFLLDRADVVRLWNPAAEAITAIPASEVVGHPATEKISGWQESVDAVPVSATPDPGHDEVVIPIDTAQGERWIAIAGVEFFGGTVYAFRDLTGVRELEEMKADFIATASHELRTPLAAVYGAAQTLLRHDFALDEGGRDRFVSLIADESERLGRIVNEILLASQLDTGRVMLETEPFDPVELVDRVVEATRAYAPPAVTVERSVGLEVPRVDADRDKVRQVLVNLVENAIKYSPDGGRIEIRVDVHDESILFSVSDEGLGIPADEQSRVFEKFYRLDPQMTRGVGGTGLGLYICNELVTRMGGHIWVESVTGEGSTFLFELPAAAAAAQGTATPNGRLTRSSEFDL